MNADINNIPAIEEPDEIVASRETAVGGAAFLASSTIAEDVMGSQDANALIGRYDS